MTAALPIAGLLESFFHRRLVDQRNASPATISSYRDSLRMLVVYAAERTAKAPCRLEVADFDRQLVLDFLDHLEQDRGNSVTTRNLRLTAIRSFLRHVAVEDPASLGVAQRVLAIPSKRGTTEALCHLSAVEVDALLAAPDRETRQGRRDHALLLFLVRTGARVSEAIAVDAADLELESPCQVLLRGKGRKQRRVPLVSELAIVLRHLCHERGVGPGEHRPMFVGGRGHRLTRFGVTHLLRRAVATATNLVPTFAHKSVSPHVLRHTLAMRLLQSGSDLVTIQAWLGHAQVATTHRYAEADIEMMRKSLREGAVSPLPERFQPGDAVLQLLDGLA